MGDVPGDPNQAAAAEAAAEAAATLHLSLARATLGAEPRSKSFTVTEGEGELIAATLAEYRLQKQVLGLSLSAFDDHFDSIFREAQEVRQENLVRL